MPSTRIDAIVAESIAFARRRASSRTPRLGAAPDVLCRNLDKSQGVAPRGNARREDGNHHQLAYAVSPGYGQSPRRCDATLTSYPRPRYLHAAAPRAQPGLWQEFGAQNRLIDTSRFPSRCLTGRPPRSAASATRVRTIAYLCFADFRRSKPPSRIGFRRNLR